MKTRGSSVVDWVGVRVVVVVAVVVEVVVVVTSSLRQFTCIVALDGVEKTEKIQNVVYMVHCMKTKLGTS